MDNLPQNDSSIHGGSGTEDSETSSIEILWEGFPGEGISKGVQLYIVCFLNIFLGFGSDIVQPQNDEGVLASGGGNRGNKF